MCKQIRVRTTIHKLRHYSATELILAGVDIRTVAGRLGHAGGGATTLRTYAAWVSEGDQRAAREIAARMPSRAGPRPLIVDIDPRTAYERMAISLRDQILDGTLLPRTTDTNDQAVGSHVRRVRSDGEARRGPAVGLEVCPGHAGAAHSCARLPIDTPDQQSVPIGDNGSADAGPPAQPATRSGPLDLEVRHLGRVVHRLHCVADPDDATTLHSLLVDTIRREGRNPSEIGDYELVVRRAGQREIVTTFVATGP
jgi:integrase